MASSVAGNVIRMFWNSILVDVLSVQSGKTTHCQRRAAVPMASKAGSSSRNTAIICGAKIKPRAESNVSIAADTEKAKR